MQFKDECDSKVQEVLKIDEELVEIDEIDSVVFEVLLDKKRD